MTFEEFLKKLYEEEAFRGKYALTLSSQGLRIYFPDSPNCPQFTVSGNTVTEVKEVRRA